MKTLASFCAWLELLGLGIFVGGMLAVGVLVAPVVFSLLPPMQAGGEVMSAIFSRFNSVFAYICLGLILAGYLGKVILVPARKVLRYIEGIALLVLLAASIYLGAFLTPEMNKLRQMRIQDPGNQQAVEQFDLRHERSEFLFTVNLLMAMTVLYVNAAQIAGKSSGS